MDKGAANQQTDLDYLLAQAASMGIFPNDKDRQKMLRAKSKTSNPHKHTNIQRNVQHSNIGNLGLWSGGFRNVFLTKKD